MNLTGLILSLMVWAHVNTGLPLPEKIPEVHKASPEVLCTILGEGENICVSGAREVIALYVEGVIMVRDDWRPDSQLGVSILLHEIVHHMQDPEQYRCIGEMEKQAYTAQQEYLAQAGVKNPLETMGLNEFMLIMTTMCHFEQ